MYLTIDMGGTFIKYALMDENAQITEKGKIPTLVEKDEIIARLDRSASPEKVSFGNNRKRKDT